MGGKTYEKESRVESDDRIHPSDEAERHGLRYLHDSNREAGEELFWVDRTCENIMNNDVSIVTCSRAGIEGAPLS